MTYKNNIAIIPARSGSKGLRDKNIKLLDGKPLMAYSIEAAKNSKIFDEIYVSTDSEYYSQIAKEWGASVPFLRNSNLATDTSSSWDVVKDVIYQYKLLGKTFNTITLLQPTSPLRAAEDIINGYNLFQDKNAQSVVSVCETDHSPLWCFTLPENASMYEYGKQEMTTMQRQQLPTYYRENGALYITTTKHLLEIDNLYDEHCFAYIMPKERSIDIDDEFDFLLAEAMLKYKKYLD